jgi:hypothetical protein
MKIVKTVKEIKIVKTVIAVYYYEKEDEKEINLNEDDLIEVYDMEDDWWYGKNVNTNEIVFFNLIKGFFPSNYIE